MTAEHHRSTTGRAVRTTGWIAVPAVLSLAYGLAGFGAAERAVTGTIAGAAVPIGRGTARAFVMLEGGKPVEIGIALTEAALEGLPIPAADMSGHDHDIGERYVLSLPADNPTPFKVVELGWNPLGHEPAGIYDIAHFDFHFYTIGLDELQAMVPSDPEFHVKAARYPDARFVPAGYFAPEPMAVPQMGVHWLHEDTPEINGRPFTATFLYGSYDGTLIFAEPMITKATIESRVDLQTPVSTAAQYQVPGYYPTAYRLYWDEASREHRVVLTGLVHSN